MQLCLGKKTNETQDLVRCKRAQSDAWRAGGGHVAALATHAQGNYALQNLMDALDKLRAGAAVLRARGGAADADLAKAEADSSDAFRAS